MTQELYLNGLSQVKAYRLLQATVSTTVRSFGLGSVSEWFLLCHIYYEKSVRASEAALVLEVEAPLVTKLSDNLIDARLVERVAYPKDKRVKLLQPTVKGEQLVPEIQAVLELELGKLLKGIKVSQLRTYQKVLGMIIRNGRLA